MSNRFTPDEASFGDKLKGKVVVMTGIYYLVHVATLPTGYQVEQQASVPQRFDASPMQERTWCLAT